MKPQRIKLARTKGWRMPANTVKVDRSNKTYGNPFAIDEVHFAFYGARRFSCWSVEGVSGLFETKMEAQAAAVARYKARIEHPQMATFRANAVAALRGKNLACWCGLDEPCHADVLLDLANA